MTTPDWLPGIRQCCAYWRDAPQLQQHLEALELTFSEENDACIDCAKSLVESVCELIITELDDATKPELPEKKDLTLSHWLTACTRVLKLTNKDLGLKGIISSHHGLADGLRELRNQGGIASHGKEAFLSKLSAYHRRAALLSADAIVAFLHEAYLEVDPALPTSREPYEKFETKNQLIDQYSLVSAETDLDGLVEIFVSLPDGSEIPISSEASRLLFCLDRTAYIQALEAAKNQKQIDEEPFLERKLEATQKVEAAEAAQTAKPSPQPLKAMAMPRRT
ncbi:MAG: hypothetical protein GC129_02065 [Proteobacteria bacterium]|nr:hypothetical protein [Pseudomonadota bacterium]